MNKKIISAALSTSLILCSASLSVYADNTQNSVSITACADSYTQAYQGKGTDKMDTTANFGKNKELKAANVGKSDSDTYLSGDSVSILNEKDTLGNYIYPPSLPDWSTFNVGYIKYKLPYVKYPENIDNIELKLQFLSIGNDTSYWTNNKSWISTYPIGIHLVENDWDEDTITHSNHPLWKNFNIATVNSLETKDSHTVNFDVTSAVKDALIKHDAEISFAFTYNNGQTNSYARPINFASRESGEQTAPKLNITYSNDIGLKENSVASYTASDDATVRFYANDATIAQTNYGSETVLLAESLDSTPISSIETINAKDEFGKYTYPESCGQWSAFKASYVKIPLSDIGEVNGIYSTKLKLYFLYINNETKWNNEWKSWVKPGTKYIFDTQIHLTDNNWNENEITYINRPEWKIFNAAAPQKISSVDNHFMEFDVTNQVKKAIENGDSEISFAITYANTIGNDYAHPIVFASKEYSLSAAPQLEVEYKPGYDPTVQHQQQPYTINAEKTGNNINIKTIENKDGYAENAKILVAEFSASDDKFISVHIEDIEKSLNSDGINITLNSETSAVKCFIWNMTSLVPLADLAER